MELRQSERLTSSIVPRAIVTYRILDLNEGVVDGDDFSLTVLDTGL
jgi:hypothetical protein